MDELNDISEVELIRFGDGLNGLGVREIYTIRIIIVFLV